MNIIRAQHINGNVRCALLRNDADVAGTVASLEAAGYWQAITVEPFTPKARH